MGPRFPVMIIAFSIMGLLLASLALPGANAEYGFDMEDDGEVYVAVLSEYFGKEPDQVREWNRKCDHVDDLAVALFMARHTGKSFEFIMALYGQGLNWWEISEGMSLNSNLWFTPVSMSPQPPFSDVYYRWKKSGESDQPLVMSDAECRGLAAVRILSEYFHVTAIRAMEMRVSDQDLQKVIAGEYRFRHERVKRNGKNSATISVSRKDPASSAD